MKEKKSKQKKGSVQLVAWKSAFTPTRLIGIALSLLLTLGLVIAMLLLDLALQREVPTAASQRIFVPAKVTAVLDDNASPDTWTEGLRIGQQELQLELLSGAYKGEVLPLTHFLSAYSNVDTKEGTRVIVRLAMNEDGAPYLAAIVNYDRGIVLGAVAIFFAALLIIIGRKQGLMALLGLGYTLIGLLFFLIPLILLGQPPVLWTVVFVAVSAAASLLLLGGFSRKTLTAILGCVGGTATAGILAWAVGTITPMNGFSMPEAEELVIRASEHHMQISGLLVCGILIASLGAAMDVAMSISSTCQELQDLNPDLSARRLFLSGMNVGRDTMGTMANTLILAFAGSSLNELLLFRAYDYPLMQIINSDLIAIEVLRGIAGTVGIILTVPLVAAINAWLLTAGRKVGKPKKQPRPVG